MTILASLMISVLLHTARCFFELRYILRLLGEEINSPSLWKYHLYLTFQNHVFWISVFLTSGLILLVIELVRNYGRKKTGSAIGSTKARSDLEESNV